MDKNQLSNESIDYQINDTFYSDLVTYLNTLRTKYPDGLKNSDWEKESLSDMLLKRFGLKVNIRSDCDYDNAMAMPPHISMNHPLYNESLGYYLKEYPDEIPGLTEFNKRYFKNPPKLTIDLKHAVVSGLFSELQNTMWIGNGLIVKKSRFRTEETAAIILHEIGHLFTYCENLPNLFRGAGLLSEASRIILSAKDKRERVYRLERFTEELEFDQIDYSKLVTEDTEKSKVAVGTILLHEHVKKIRNITTANRYDIKNNEQLADQFAIRFDAGKALYMGLIKLYGPHRYTTHHAIGSDLVTVMMTTYLLTLMPLLIPLWLLLFVTNAFDPSDLYDSPRDRLTAIRKQIIENLKTPNLSTDVRVRLVMQLDEINKLNIKVKDTWPLLGRIWSVINPTGRRVKKQHIVNKEIEDMINNDLFFHAVKLELESK